MILSTRGRAVALLACLCGLGGVPVADAAAPAPRVETRYVEPGSALAWSMATAPLSTEIVLGLAIDALLAARRFRGGLPVEAAAAAVSGGAAAAAFLGEEPVGAWRPPAAAPFPFALPSDRRVALLRVRARLRVGPERATLAGLRLRVRYQDSIVIRLNGREVATRAASAGPFASLPKSPEWETFHVPVTPGLLVAGDNELTLDVRPSSARLEPQVDLEVVGTSAARIVRGPLLERVGETRATIVFETDVPTEAEVRWGLAPGKLDRRNASARGTRHAVVLDRLPRDQEITYQVATPSDVSPTSTFHAAPPRGAALRFVVFGDTRSGHDVHARIARSIAAERPDFLVSTGDAVLYGHDEADWQTFFAIAGPLLGCAPLYPACGNHDLGRSGDDGRTFEDLFAVARSSAGVADGSWYGFDVGDAHVAMLDSNRYDDPAQAAWLDADLKAARARGARVLFAATHHGPWSRGPHGGNAHARQVLVPILAANGVAMLFAGHDHLYQRGESAGLRYVVTGGGGAPIYPIVCKPGIAGCDPDDGAITVLPEHHYLVLEVAGDQVRMCPKRPDGAPLEACVTFGVARAASSR